LEIISVESEVFEVGVEENGDIVQMLEINALQDEIQQSLTDTHLVSEYLVVFWSS
jgi:hypothetical protein